MNEFLDRQLSMLRKLIGEYREGALSLNSLIQRIEGVGAAIDSPAWSDSSFSILLSMEQINAIRLDTNRSLTQSDTEEIEKHLRELEKLIGKWESDLTSGKNQEA